MASTHALLTEDMSAAQMGIWVGQQLKPKTPMYNAAEYVEFHGALNMDVFTQAIQHAVLKTAALHILFKPTSTTPKQVYKASSSHVIFQDFSIPTHNTENKKNNEITDKNLYENPYESPHESPYEKAQRWMQEKTAEPIDISTGPIFSQVIIKLSDTHFLWYQRIHHIAADGFSFALLTQKIIDHYNTLMQPEHIVSSRKISENTHAVIDASIEKFNKIVAEDQHYHQSKNFIQDKIFWAEYLRDQSYPVSFSRAVTDIADYTIRSSVNISSTQFDGIKTLAQTISSNWSNIFIASVAQCIYQYTATPETTLGIPVMGRMGSASLRIPSMVMNIIPLRIDLSNNTSLCELTRHIATGITQSRPHSRYRYEQLRRDKSIDSQTPSNNKTQDSNAKLFGAVVNIMPFDRTLNIHGCNATLHNMSAGPVEDISFSFMVSHDNSIQFTVDANPNRYDINELHVIKANILTILNNASVNWDKTPHIHTDNISWIEGKKFKEKNTLTNQDVISTLYHQIKKSPNNMALHDKNHDISYSELSEKITRAALAIFDKKVHIETHKTLNLRKTNTTDRKNNNNKINDCVIALALPRNESAIIAAFACLLTNHTFVFIDINAPKIRNQHILSDAQPNILISDDAFSESHLDFIYKHKIHTLSSTEFEKIYNTQHAAFDLWNHLWKHIPETYAPAYLIYTSGSTGIPKGVMVGRKALSDFIESTVDTYAITPQDRILQFAPLHFDACIEEIFSSLTRGACLVLRNEEMLESLPTFISQCADWKISILDLPTAFWHELAFYCVNTQTDLPPQLHSIIIGGEAVLPERVKQWRACYGNSIALFNTYGPSETTVVATATNLTAKRINNTYPKLSIGQPLNNRAIAVVDDNLHILPKGEPGELLIFGAGIGDGYLHQPEKTKEHFIQYTLPWYATSMAYRTGDRVKINDENNIEFIGRIDDQIKISGYRIEPLEIESAINRLHSIREAAITIQHQNNKTPYVIAHIVSHNRDAMNNSLYDISHLRSELADLLPPPMLPSFVIEHTSLKKTSSGKIDRHYLISLTDEKETQHQQSDNEQSNNITSEQRIIRDVWQECLGNKNIQLHDDFFLLGGSSLQSIQVANRLAILFKRDVPVTLIFDNPSIHLLNQALMEEKEANQENIENKIHADCLEFDLELPHNNKKNSDKNKKIENILLTGATGFVGAHLLHQLLTQTCAMITCIVRASDVDNAMLRIRKALETQKLSIDEHHRIHIICADLEKPLLGLNQKDFNHLANTTDAVIHNAAITSVMRDYNSLRAANTLSTACLLQLAAINALPFHLISTIAVAPPSLSNEDVLYEAPVLFHSGLQDGYQQSKWASEQMATIAQNKNYPVKVYRLARVTGSTETGYINPKDLVWGIIRSGLRNHALPNLSIAEPWTPVDVIARFIIAHSLNDTESGFLNLTPQHTIEITKIYEWLKDSGLQASTLPVNAWRDEVKRNNKINPSFDDQAILGFFEQRAHITKANGGKHLSIAPINNEKFTKKLTDLGLHLPEITQPVFKRYLQYAIASGIIHQSNTPTSHTVFTQTSPTKIANPEEHKEHVSEEYL